MSLVIRILPAFTLSTVALFSFTPTANAQLEHSRVVENPPLLDIIRQAQPRSILKGVPAPAIETALNLNVTYTNGKIWNPAEQRYDAVKLRSYQGKGVNPDTPYVSPTISIFPGETIQMTLNNKLPPDPTCSTKIENVNMPHCFNGTNLHTHGLWVNPAGNGDNVLISINPGVSFQYEYKVPSDHPAGTFWYHTHRHGSTALQVASGMAGALIIRGTRFPSQTANGDIDTLLTSTEAQPFIERLLVMQQIQYACRDAQGKIKTNPDGSYKCDPGDVGGVDGSGLHDAVALRRRASADHGDPAERRRPATPLRRAARPARRADPRLPLRRRLGAQALGHGGSGPAALLAVRRAAADPVRRRPRLHRGPRRHRGPPMQQPSSRRDRGRGGRGW